MGRHNGAPGRGFRCRLFATCDFCTVENVSTFDEIIQIFLAITNGIFHFTEQCSHDPG